MEKLNRYLINIILNHTTYSGNKKSGKRILSASSLSKNDLEIYLMHQNGLDKAERIELNTLGTLAHEGLENAFKDEDICLTEERLEYPLPNGWIISGSMDLIIEIMLSIIDWKVPNMDVLLKDIAKNGKGSDYALQMGVYKWLAYQRWKEEYNTYLGTLNKKQSHFAENASRDVFKLIEVDTYSIEEIEAIMIEKTDRIDQYLESGIEPAQCESILWSSQYGKKKIPATCRFYCGVSSGCKYYQRYKKGSDANKLKNLLKTITKKKSVVDSGMNETKL